MPESELTRRAAIILGGSAIYAGGTYASRGGPDDVTAPIPGSGNETDTDGEPDEDEAEVERSAALDLTEYEEADLTLAAVTVEISNDTGEFTEETINLSENGTQITEISREIEAGETETVEVDIEYEHYSPSQIDLESVENTVNLLVDPYGEDEEPARTWTARSTERTDQSSLPVWESVNGRSTALDGSPIYHESVEELNGQPGVEFSDEEHVLTASVPETDEYTVIAVYHQHEDKTGWVWKDSETNVGFEDREEEEVGYRAGRSNRRFDSPYYDETIVSVVSFGNDESLAAVNRYIGDQNDLGDSLKELYIGGIGLSVVDGYIPHIEVWDRKLDKSEWKPISEALEQQYRPGADIRDPIIQ